MKRSETPSRISWNLPPQQNYLDDKKNLQEKETTEVDNKSETKYILTWCEAYGGYKYGWEFGEEKFRSAGCAESRCYLTSDRNLLDSVSDFDAIVFHQRSFQFSDSPSHRVPRQRYVHWMFESPAHSGYDFTPTIKLAGFFNWSLSYRLDSHFPRPYGKFLEIHQPPQMNLSSHIEQFGQKNTNLSRKTNTEGKGIAAWFVSNCNSKSGREELVKELKKHIGVDVYGKGGCSDPGLRCDREQDGQCLQMLNTSYKFYLSLENSLCADYVTEKFWKVLGHNVIPVVLNGANMSNIAPRHSYIDFKDFNSIKDAADYMVKVSEDDSLFASYFWWREFYSPTQSVEAEAWCSLCSALHNQSLGEAVISNLHHWWEEEAHCHSSKYKYVDTNSNSKVQSKYHVLSICLLLLSLIIYLK